MAKVALKKAKQKDAAYALAHHAVSLRYEALSQPLVDLTKHCILDTLGVTIAASTLTPEARIVVDLVRELGGKEESTTLGFGGKAPAAWAAFANGSMGHMLDYDDMPAHPSITTVPVAFAVAEKLGGTSGRDLITAIAVGIDIMKRLGNAITIREWNMTEGWFPAQLLGFISGTATAGRLLGLSEDQMVNALGIAFSQLSGSRQMAVGEATHMRGMLAGFTGQGSILSALLAQRGITGPKEILEGRYGLFNLYVRTNPDRDALLGGLSTRFPILENHGFKPWPACKNIHTTVAAVLDLRKTHGLRPEDVKEMVVVGGDLSTAFLSEPIKSKRHPKSGIDAKYSIPFTAAVAMVKGNVILRAYTEEGLNDREVLAMAQRVRYQPIPQEEKTSYIPTVEVHTQNGKLYASQIEHPQGSPKNPLSQDQLETKFRDCVSFSAKAIPHANIDRTIGLISRLETLHDATEIIKLLA